MERGIIVADQTRIWYPTPRVAYASISEMKIVAPPVAKFGMSADAACLSDLGGSRKTDEFANADSWPKVIAFLNEAFDHQI